MTRASRATVRVPAAGPKRRTDVKTNVSEMEMVAGTDGSLTVAEPLTRVRMANRNQFHPMGDAYKTYAECAIAHTPTLAIAQTYTRAHRDSPLLVIRFLCLPAFRRDN